jgi:hypothetical protein
VPSQQPADLRELAPGDQVGNGRAVPRDEDAQVRVEPVAGPGLGDDRGRASLGQELQIPGPVGEAHRGQVRLGQGHPGDRERVPGVALARAPGPAALAAGQLRRDLDDIEPRRDEMPGEDRPVRGGALDPDPHVGLREPRHPGRECRVPGRLIAERPLLAGQAQLVHEARCERVPVGVDPDRRRCHRPSSRAPLRWARAGRAAVR